MQARRLKLTETLQEYFLTMRDLAHKRAVDDSSLIDYIIDGIPDSSNHKIILYGSKTFSEFKNKLKIYETHLNSKHRIGRDRVESRGYFKNFTTIQKTAFPAKIHVVNDETIPLDAIIGVDFLQQTQFTFGRDGIRTFRDVDECKNDDVFGKPCQPFA
ncbi:retrovirus-related Pol polyprotein from transposon 17.6 [Trichonephila clavipes]|nr:retrovirus-related Pol polyprotein from transposon 17.6 [Trichonephila clavipes]